MLKKLLFLSLMVVGVSAFADDASSTAKYKNNPTVGSRQASAQMFTVQQDFTNKTKKTKKKASMAHSQH